MKDTFTYLVILLILLLVIPVVSLIRFSNKKSGPSAGDKPYMISVFNVRDFIVEDMELEDYIMGVVAGEMPAEFEMEALKAQAIAARTYTIGRTIGKYGSASDKHFGAAVCTDPTHCQAWISKEKYISSYKDETGLNYWNKIKEAVESTKGKVLTYGGEIINPLYHANSGGVTEDVEAVWNITSIPYLKSVYSMGEEKYSSYEKEYTFTREELVEKLKTEYPDIVLSEETFSDNFEITQYSSSNRIIEVRIGNHIIQGTELRSILTLNSTSFQFDFSGNSLKITTFGYGHGVGMSQCGANSYALEGKDYAFILKYYYSGVEIEDMWRYLK